MWGMDPLRAAPGADIVLAAVAGRAGRARRRRRGPRRPAGQGAARAGPGRRGRRGAGRAARRGARRRHADRPRALRDRDRAHRRVRLRPRERAPRALPAAGRAAGGRAGRDDRGGPGAPGLHRQRDGGRRARRRRARTGRARARTSQNGVLRVLHERSFVDDPTRMLRLVRYAARLEFAPDPGTRGADRPRAAARRSPATASATSCACCSASRRRRCGCWTRYGLGRALLGDGFEVTWLAERAGPGLLALAACCTKIAVKSSPPASTTSGSWAGTGTLWWPRRAASSLSTVPWTSATPSCGAFCVASVPRPSSCSPRRATRGARRWLDDVRHRRLAITGDDLVARGPDRRRGRRGPVARDGGDARRPRARSRVARLARRSSMMRGSVIDLRLTTRPNTHILSRSGFSVEGESCAETGLVGAWVLTLGVTAAPAQAADFAIGVRDAEP